MQLVNVLNYISDVYLMTMLGIGTGLFLLVRYVYLKIKQFGRTK